MRDRRATGILSWTILPPLERTWMIKLILFLLVINTISLYFLLSNSFTTAAFLNNIAFSHVLVLGFLGYLWRRKNFITIYRILGSIFLAIKIFAILCSMITILGITTSTIILDTSITKSATRVFFLTAFNIFYDVFFLLALGNTTDPKTSKPKTHQQKHHTAHDLS